jgi:hypothetical protein
MMTCVTFSIKIKNKKIKKEEEEEEAKNVKLVHVLYLI